MTHGLRTLSCLALCPCSPGRPGPPPGTFTGTPRAGGPRYEKDVKAYNDHLDKVIAYGDAEAEAARIDRQYATTCQALKISMRPTSTRPGS